MNLRAGDNRHTVFFDLLTNHRRGVAILARHDLRAVGEQGHLAAEALKTLRQLATDGTGADDGETTRQLGQRKNRLVGVVAGVTQAGDRRLRGARAGGDHRAVELQTFAVDFDGRRIDEAAIADEDIDAQLTKSLRRIMFADAGAQPAHALHRRGKIDLRLAGDGERRIQRRCARRGRRARRGSRPWTARSRR